jgi:hypothetical protein
VQNCAACAASCSFFWNQGLKTDEVSESLPFLLNHLETNKTSKNNITVFIKKTLFRTFSYFMSKNVTNLNAF